MIGLGYRRNGKSQTLRVLRNGLIQGAGQSIALLQRLEKFPLSTNKSMFRVQDNLSCLLTGTIGHIGVRLSRQWIRPHVILRLAFILFRFGLGSGLLLQGLFVSRLRGKKPFDGLNDLLRLIPPCGIQGLFTLLQSFDDCPGPLDTPSAYFLQGTVRVRYPVFFFSSGRPGIRPNSIFICLFSLLFFLQASLVPLLPLCGLLLLIG